MSNGRTWFISVEALYRILNKEGLIDSSTQLWEKGDNDSIRCLDLATSLKLEYDVETHRFIPKIIKVKK